jgi:hypothetical protein
MVANTDEGFINNKGIPFDFRLVIAHLGCLHYPKTALGAGVFE